ncbi:MAG: iron ABC transporter permease [Bacteroidota bacterium]
MATAGNRYRLKFLVVLPIIVLILFLLDISLGSVHIPPGDIINILTGGEGEKPTWSAIILQFRLPKALTAILAGAALSISGLQMQTLFRNPLAGPFVLGISSGASLGVAIVVLAGAAIGGVFLQSGLNHWILILAATAGSSAVLFLVVLVSLRIQDSMGLLIIGLMFGSATGAIVSMLQFFSSAEQIQVYLIWTFGSLGGLDWSELYMLLPVVIIGIAIAVSLIKPLNAFLLGEHYAQSLGLNIRKSRNWIIISTSLLAGSVTAFCGPIAFIGLAVPHLGRMLFSTSDHKVLLPATVFIGMIIMLGCDIVSQLPGSQQVLPINAVTSLLGAPVVIWVILRRRSVKGAFGG